MTARVARPTLARQGISRAVAVAELPSRQASSHLSMSACEHIRGLN
jgi:hypothetical protein